MQRQSGIRLLKLALAAGAAATFLLASPATRDWVITTAHAAAQRVLVTNTESRPIPVTSGNEFFQQQVVISMVGTATSDSDTFSVPAGRRLILENIGGKGAAPGIALVEVSQAGKDAIMTPSIVSTIWKWAGTTSTKVAFEPGTVSVIIRRPSAPGGSTINSNYITLTGYLVPID